MRDAKREKSQHGYLPTVVDRTLALTRRCAHPMFMGCPRVAQRDAAPSPGSLLRLTLRPHYRDVNVWAFIAQHVPEMNDRVARPRPRRDYTRVRIQPLRVLLRPKPKLSAHLFNFANRSSGISAAGITGCG